MSETPANVPDDAASHRPGPADADEITDVIGWAFPAGRRRRIEPSRLRSLLASALGVPRSSFSAMTDDDVEIAMSRVRALADQYHRASETASVDDLTSALRRGPGLQALQRDIDRNRRGSAEPLSCIFLDVDGLKRVNDSRGHPAGDDLLVSVVAAIRERLRSYDLIVRYGGDEFFCILSNTSLEDAQQLAAAIAESVATRTVGTITTGVATLGDDDDAMALVARADLDLYAARERSGHATSRR